MADDDNIEVPDNEEPEAVDAADEAADEPTVIEDEPTVVEDEPTVLDDDPTLMDGDASVQADEADEEVESLSPEEQAMLAAAMGDEPTVVEDPAEAGAVAASTAAVSKPQVQATPVSFAPIAEVAAGQEQSIEFIFDIPVEVSVRLGETKILIRDLLQLGQGSVVELDKLAGEPLEVVVNDKLMARGEVVVVNEKFGVRLTDVIAPAERIHSLK